MVRSSGIRAVIFYYYLKFCWVFVRVKSFLSAFVVGVALGAS